MINRNKFISGRNLRIADQIHKDLSEIMTLKLKDPRIRMITITEVQVNLNYTHAKIFFTVFTKNKKAIQDVLFSLNKASCFLRMKLSKRLSIYTLPNLHFLYDNSVVYNTKILHLIKQANIIRSTY